MAENTRDDDRNDSDSTDKKSSMKLKLGKLRRDSRARMILIVILMIVVACLFFFWGKFKAVLVGIFILLMVALGLETSGNDLDLGRLLETGSIEESRVQKSEDGFWSIGDDCRGEIDYNCDNFATKEDAQAFFDQCGGSQNDVSALDGDGDSEACESLPAAN